MRWIKAFNPNALTGERRATWEGWESGARNATDRMLRDHPDGDGITFNRKIWADLKEWLFLNVFDGKCAYCEADVRPASYGAGEHWRPKGAVTEREGDIEVEVVDPETGNRHPGYYWLAYSWENLVPACDECNSGSGGFRGKGTQFPIEGTRAFGPDDAKSFDELNELERPLLLHPFGKEDPRDHLDFNEFGQAVAKDGSLIGKTSIEVFNLLRPLLDDRRRRLHDDLRSQVKKALGVQLTGGQSATEALRMWTDAERPFSLAAGIYAKRWRKEVIKDLENDEE